MTSSANLFQELANLYDSESYAALRVRCTGIVRSSKASPYDQHVAYSFRALAKIRTKNRQSALEDAAAALTYSATCPWARWVMLYALEANMSLSDDEQIINQAISLGSGILEDGLGHIQRDKCSKGMPPGAQKAVLNDSRFLLAFVHLERGDLSSAKDLLDLYLANFDAKYSEFTKEEAEEVRQRIESDEREQKV